jgi:hypothetical protein
VSFIIFYILFNLLDSFDVCSEEEVVDCGVKEIIREA